MQWWCDALATVALLIANSPVVCDPTSAEIRSLRNAGYKIEGRDPCHGTGICCALLPANTNGEVYYVTLPGGKWQAEKLRLLAQFPNLTQVRASRAATTSEYDTLCQLVPDKSPLLLHVLGQDGKLQWTGDLTRKNRK